MTIQKVLDMVDELKPNMMQRETKINYLSILDGMIFHEIVMKHEPAQGTEWPVLFLHTISEMIENVIDLADLKDIDALGQDADRIRGEIHRAILFNQVRWPQIVLDFMTALEDQFIAKIRQIQDPDEPLTKAEMISFLETVDGILQKKGAQENKEPAYDRETDPGTELLVKEPYAEELYTAWLFSKIDMMNREMGDYNNDRAMFENAYDTYSDWYTRNHMPRTERRRFNV